MNASVRLRQSRTFAFISSFAGMTVDTSAAQFDPSLVEPKGRPLMRLLAPVAIALALLSAFLTFVVLTGLTRIEPTREVAVSFILMNGATILVLLGIIFREVWQLMQARRRGQAAARPNRSLPPSPSPRPRSVSVASRPLKSQIQA